VDAAPPVDAVPEKIKMVQLRIGSVPSGATVIKDGVVQSEVTPAMVEIVDKEKDVKFTLQLDGYDDYEFSVNPKEKLPEDNKLTLMLKRATKPQPQPQPGTRPVPRPPGTGSGAGSGSGSAGRPTNPTGGELGGNPLHRGGAPKPQ
jgi:hypothetical protein